MAKLAYLLFAASSEEARTLAAPLRDEIGPRLLAAGAETLGLNVADVVADLGDSMPLVRAGEALAGLVTLTLTDAGKRGPLEAELGRSGAQLAGYRVRESIPVEYGARDWPDGEASPGVKLVTCFNEKPGLTDEAFFHEWHEVHTPLSLEVHPMRRYVRNAVEEPITARAPRFRGIVEEQFANLETITDPKRFYGASGDWRANFERVAKHVPSFLDLGSMRNALMTEHVLRG